MDDIIVQASRMLLSYKNEIIWGGNNSEKENIYGGSSYGDFYGGLWK